MIRMTMSEKDMETLKTALGCLDNAIRGWSRDAADHADSEGYNHYLELKDDLNALKARVREAQRITL